jgi:PKD repeat protein
MPTLKSVSKFLGLSSELKMAAKLGVKAPVSTIALIKAYEKTPPRAALKQDKTQGAAGITVQFTDESAGYIRNREWKFGDGKTDHAANPSHTYEHADCNNQYAISLTVSNEGEAIRRRAACGSIPRRRRRTLRRAPGQ